MGDHRGKGDFSQISTWPVSPSTLCPLICYCCCHWLLIARNQEWMATVQSTGKRKVESSKKGQVEKNQLMKASKSLYPGQQDSHYTSLITYGISFNIYSYSGNHTGNWIKGVARVWSIQAGGVNLLVSKLCLFCLYRSNLEVAWRGGGRQAGRQAESQVSSRLSVFVGHQVYLYM